MDIIIKAGPASEGAFIQFYEVSKRCIYILEWERFEAKLVSIIYFEKQREKEYVDPMTL